MKSSADARSILTRLRYYIMHHAAAKERLYRNKQRVPDMLSAVDCARKLYASAISEIPYASFCTPTRI